LDLRIAALKRRGLAGLAPVALATWVAASADASAQALPTPAGSAAVRVAEPAAATATAPAAAIAPSAAEGRRAYMSFCVRCHGIELVSSSSAYFDLRTFPKGDKERFVRAVAKGLRAMPAWEGTLKPEQIDAIWAYVGSVNGWGSAEAAK
jgi:cytochrome c55X